MKPRSFLPFSILLFTLLAACSHQPKKPYGKPFPINSSATTAQSATQTLPQFASQPATQQDNHHVQEK